MVSRVIPVEPFDLVVFGGTGDLARRKILPALLRRFHAGQVPPESRIVGAARSALDDSGYRDAIRAAFAEFAPELSATESETSFLERLFYARVDASSANEDGKDLFAKMELQDPSRVRAFYLSVAPGIFGPIARRLSEWKLVDDRTRVVVEKPFGHDLASARELNAILAGHFEEGQIYRIDHYLGKETVQNLMAIRFGNMLFEPLWNSQYVDNIQITVAEEVGVGGRGSYYDGSGAMRDMVQNHLMQLLCLIAMEPPSKFEPDAVRDEKLKVIRALDPVKPDHVARGQYLADSRDPEAHPGYREAVGNPNSLTESYVAMKVHVSNWRWAGTPFYLRTGKRLKARSSVINVIFKDAPHSIFGADAGRHANRLSIRLQPNEGITLTVTIKEPGPGGMRLVDVPLDMTFAEALGTGGERAAVDAYERLIMDVIRGNQTLFMRGDEVEAAWAWADPAIREWEDSGAAPEPYESGSAGPPGAGALIARDRRVWQGINP